MDSPRQSDATERVLAELNELVSETARLQHAVEEAAANERRHFERRMLPDRRHDGERREHDRRSQRG